MTRYDFAKHAVWFFGAVGAYLAGSAIMGMPPPGGTFVWTWWHPALAVFIAVITGIAWCVRTIDEGPPKRKPAPALSKEEQEIIEELRRTWNKP